MEKSAPSVPPHERLALCHAALVVVVSAWLLGGIGPLGEWIVAGLAAPSFWLLGAEARVRFRAGDKEGVWRLLRWGAPLAGLAILTLISAFNPSHREAFLYDGYVLRPVPHLAWLPSSADPAGSVRILACFGGLAATGLSLAFCVQSRQALRTFVWILAANAIVLAVLGTLQNQMQATGPFFGGVAAVNTAWFSTFLYHNHWGAFAALQVAATLGLVFHSLRHSSQRGWLHTPGPFWAVAALVIAATAPLSSSRSATGMMLVLALCAAAFAVRHLRRLARHHGSPRGALIGGLALLLVLSLGAGLVAFQSREVIGRRLQATFTQIDDLRSGSAHYTRLDLYSDTWRMAADRPVFGWGLESYGPIFLNYSTFEPGPDGLMNTFVDAHSDWLQSLAEIGFVGTGLLLALALQPLGETLRLRRLPGFAGWLLGGCALVAVYAWVEFPFANPAVAGTWWVLFFTAIRTLQLTPSSGETATSAHPEPRHHAS